MTNAPRPGWYPDPARVPDVFRWWDGETWTDLLSDSPHAPAPDVVEHPVETAAPPRRRSALRTVVALVVVVALFLSAGVGVGLWLWDVGSRSSGTTPAGRTAGPPAATATGPSEPPGQLDESTRTATIGSASMRLPDDPYALRPDPVSLPGVLDAAFVAEAEVHDRFDGEHDWSAMVALVALSPSLTEGVDLEQAGRSTAARLAKAMYGKQLVKVTEPQIADRSIDNYPGIEFNAEIHYAVDRLPSRYDTLRVIAVKLDDGTVVAAMSSIPDDAGPHLVELARRSLDSLTIN